MTFHKAQGQTYGGNLIISANKSSTGSALTLAPVYVALSRVKYLKCLRFMPLDVGRAKELAQLSYPHNLKMWARNYTDGLVDLVVDGVLDVVDCLWRVDRAPFLAMVDIVSRIVVSKVTG